MSTFDRGGVGLEHKQHGGLLSKSGTDRAWGKVVTRSKITPIYTKYDVHKVDKVSMIECTAFG